MLIAILARKDMKQFQNFLITYSLSGKRDGAWDSINEKYIIEIFLSKKALQQETACLPESFHSLHCLWTPFPAIWWNLSYETGHHIPWSVTHVSCNLLQHWINTPKHLFKQSLLKLNCYDPLIISFSEVWLVRGKVRPVMYPMHFGKYEAD